MSENINESVMRCMATIDSVNRVAKEKGLNIGLGAISINSLYDADKLVIYKTLVSELHDRLDMKKLAKDNWDAFNDIKNCLHYIKEIEKVLANEVGVNEVGVNTTTISNNKQDKQKEEEAPKRESNTKPKINYNKKLNPSNNPIIERGLVKLPHPIKELLVKHNVTIKLGDILYEGKAGVFTTFVNNIVLDYRDDNIEDALLHEIGHALDYILGIHREQKIISSYRRREIRYNSEYYYSTIEEYIAESISEYYNDTLDRQSNMYRELNRILRSVR